MSLQQSSSLGLKWLLKSNRTKLFWLNQDYIASRGVNRMVRHDSIRYRFSYPTIQYLPIPQKIIRYDFDHRY